MKHIFILLFSIVLFNSENIEAQTFQQISVDLAKVIIENNADNPQFTILDVRTPEEYAAGHIENAFNRNFYDADFEQQLDSLDKNRTYLIYCQAGVRSGFAYQMTQELGFTDVSDMLGGTSAWVAAGYPLSFNPPPNIDIYANNETCGGGNFAVKSKVFLEGFYNGDNTMSTDLNDENLIPLQAPFETETIGLDAQINDAVDWVKVCLRTEKDATAAACQAAMLLSNGTIVDINENECLSFENLSSSNSYYVSVHHKGHLSVLSEVAISSGGNVDFTAALNTATGIEPMKNENGVFVLFGGDYDSNGNVNSLDFNAWSQDGATVNSYKPVDGDGNGIVNNLDYNIWATNRSKVGLSFDF